MAKARSYHVKMSEQGYSALHKIAAAERRPLADVVREALELYAKSKGEEVSFDVDRGGYRERDASDAPADDSSASDALVLAA